jgi:hypothetical protein
VLHDTGTVRIHYSGYSGGFTGNIRFAFIEGTPERKVLKLDRLWHGNFNYGHGSTPINTALGTKSSTPPAGFQLAEVKMNITGHGGDDNACAEFCPNVYTLGVNGNTLVQQRLFNEDCSANDLYPQSGTWVYARTGWCPGALVRTLSHNVTGISAGTPFNLALTFPAYTSTTNRPNTFSASYTIDGNIVYYGTPNKGLDASLEDIIAPTNAEYHWRENPTSLQPKLTVRNSGSTVISRITFSYGVAGRLKHNYTWNGMIPAFQTMDIVLPSLAQLRLAPGDYGFNAEILQVNGANDDDALNNRLSSTFTAAPVWPKDFSMQMRTSEAHPNMPGIAQTAWRIEDAAGNTVARKSDCPVNTTCTDTVRLTSGGAYRLIVTDTIAYGFYDIPSANVVGVLQGNGVTGGGFVRALDLDQGFQLSMPGNYGGNFGSGFVHHFYTGEPASVTLSAKSTPSMMVYPNPASDVLHVSVDGLSAPNGRILLQDMFGRTVRKLTYTRGTQTIPVSGLANGVYQVYYSSDSEQGIRIQQRVLIAR